MLYLIGGPGRSGKTTLAMKLLRSHGISYFSLDYLMMGLFHGAPMLGIDPNQPEASVAPKMQNVVRPLATAMLENDEDYCLEGFAITPTLVYQLMDRFAMNIRVSFLGYCLADPEDKLEQERSHTTANPWPTDIADSKALAEFERMKAASIRLKKECIESNLPFFDTSIDFMRMLDRACEFLIEEHRSAN